MAEILRVFDRYEIIRRVASGGMGDLFLSRQVGVGGFSRLAVLKSLKAEVVDNRLLFSQFLNEARSVAKLNHPHVVAVYEIDQWRGIYFIAMEFIRGPNLGAVAKKCRLQGQTIPWRISASMVRHAALGLQHAHEAVDESQQQLGIVHRDISPGNLMVRLDGIVKVVDFGIASMARQLDPQSMGVIQGKLRYMAPEQSRGEPTTPAVDQYALGVVLWELLTGHKSKEPAQRRGWVPPSRVDPRVPPELDALAMRMLRPHAQERFPSCRHVAEALQAFLSNTGGAAEEQVAGFVTRLFGTDIDALTQNLTPEPVEVAGLLRTASVPCPACQTLNPVRHRHCFSCGHTLEAEPGSSSRPVRPPSATPSGGASVLGGSSPTGSLTPGSSSGSTRLRAMAQNLAQVLGRGRSVQLELAMVGPREGLAALPDSLASQGRKVVRRDDHALWLWADPRELDLGLSQALRIARQLRRTHPGDWGFGIDLRTPDSISAQPGSEPAVQWARWAQTAQEPHPVVSEAWTSVRLPGIRLRPVLLETPEYRATRWTAHLVDGPVEVTEPRLRGREELMTDVEQLLAEVHAGGRKALHLRGPGGSGRSRMLDEVRLRALAAGFVCLECTSESIEANVERWLKHLLRRLDLVPSADHFEALGLSKHLAESLAEWFDRESHGKEQADAARALWVRAVAEGSKLKPVCILSDDVEQCTPETRSLLDDLVHRVRDGRLFWVSTSGVDVHTRATEATLHRSLVPLSDETILQIAEECLQGPPPGPAVPWLLRECRGLPKWVPVLTQLALEAGLLVRSATGVRLSASPAALEGLGIQQLWEYRISREVSDELETCLQVAAVLGLRFDADIALQAAGLTDRSVWREAAQNRLAQPLQGNVWGFQDPSIRTMFLHGLSEEDRRRIHRRVGGLLLDAGAPEAGVRHLVAGEDFLKAVQTLVTYEGLQLPLTDWARLAQAPCPDLSPDEATMFGCLAMESLLCGDLAAAEAAGDLWVVPEASPSVTVRALRARARVLRARSQRPRARRDLEQALRCVTTSVERAYVLTELAALHEDQGDLESAGQLLMEALGAVEEFPEDEPDFGWTQSNALGRIYLKLGRPEDADAAFEEAEQLARASGRPLGVLRACSNRAVVQAQRGDEAAAEALLQAALAIGTELDDPLEISRVSFNLGRLKRTKDVGAAVRMFESALEAATRAGWTEGEAMAHQALNGLPRATDARN